MARLTETAVVSIAACAIASVGWLVLPQPEATNLTVQKKPLERRLIKEYRLKAADPDRVEDILLQQDEYAGTIIPRAPRAGGVYIMATQSLHRQIEAVIRRLDPEVEVRVVMMADEYDD